METKVIGLPTDTRGAAWLWVLGGVYALKVVGAYYGVRYYRRRRASRAAATA